MAVNVGRARTADGVVLRTTCQLDVDTQRTGTNDAYLSYAGFPLISWVKLNCNSEPLPMSGATRRKVLAAKLNQC